MRRSTLITCFPPDDRSRLRADNGLNGHVDAQPAARRKRADALIGIDDEGADEARERFGPARPSRRVALLHSAGRASSTWRRARSSRHGSSRRRRCDRASAKAAVAPIPSWRRDRLLARGPRAEGRCRRWRRLGSARCRGGHSCRRRARPSRQTLATAAQRPGGSSCRRNRGTGARWGKAPRLPACRFRAAAAARRCAGRTASFANAIAESGHTASPHRRLVPMLDVGLRLTILP